MLNISNRVSGGIKRIAAIHQQCGSLHTSKLACNDAKKQGIFERVFGSHVEQATQAHSVLLAKKQVLYELQSIWTYSKLATFFNYKIVIF